MWFFYLACDYRGKVNETDDGQCICKRFATGQYCNKCIDGMWNLRLENSEGCESKYMNIISKYLQYARRGYDPQIF